MGATVQTTPLSIVSPPALPGSLSLSFFLALSPFFSSQGPVRIRHACAPFPQPSSPVHVTLIDRAGGSSLFGPFLVSNSL